ncbi:MAG: hypothetical protein PHE61_06060 [Candidatus Omnitrophica bacterium]|nr:hypothetical protein [Candidatus Omnitrophota bacterium]
MRLTLNVKDEDVRYLELLKDEARRERRTMSQQAAYIIQRYFTSRQKELGN